MGEIERIVELILVDHVVLKHDAGNDVVERFVLWRR